MSEDQYYERDREYTEIEINVKLNFDTIKEWLTNELGVDHTDV